MAEWLDEAARQRGSTVAETLLEAFGVGDVDGFWQTVDTNLKAERFRLVFVSNRIGDELRRIIEFLNRQMASTEVLAIEVKQYTDADGAHQTIVPRVLGDTAEARAVKRPTPRAARLSRETLIDGIRQRSAVAANAAEHVLDWADNEPRLRTRYGLTSVAISTAGGEFLRIVVGGDIQLHLKAIAQQADSWDEQRVEQLVEDLDEIGVQLGPNRNSPKAPLEPLADDARRERFLALMERVLDNLTVGP